MKLYRKRTLTKNEASWWYSIWKTLAGNYALTSSARKMPERIGNYPTREEAEAAREAHWQNSPVPGLQEVKLCYCHVSGAFTECRDCQGSGVVPVKEKP